jgi:hypothetical protein
VASVVMDGEVVAVVAANLRVSTADQSGRSVSDGSAFGFVHVTVPISTGPSRSYVYARLVAGSTR